ncbi:YgaP family membrane protein [Rhizobium paknamense]|uniref:Inner membrane protein YgaP-like transmembrane domain-containing protein n=1 Tax=Rhizobium paknamense TaxID=1206817 RepID=A0ABU0IJT1_9HYPH|nr:DUF2892 domain-containing protein [Rhizobium paknamense]MDQ0457491.1 hypothetical protein [Rhizobium paknamense]
MKNVGSVDRAVRVILGLCLVALPFVTPWLASWGNWQFVVPAVGVVMILTAVIRFCPAYTLLGLNTCKLR